MLRNHTEWWFHVLFIYAEDFSLSTESNLMHIAPWSENDMRQLRPVIPIFERNEMTECPRKPQEPTSIGITWHIQPFSTQSAHSVSYRFFSCSCSSSRSSSQGTVNSLNQTPLQCLAAFLFECELEIVEMSWDPLKLSSH